MGQKTNPIANRLGIIRGWDSNWFGGKNFEPKLVEDDKIRKYLNARLSKAGIAKIVIERTLKLVTVTIHTARPGIIIGKGGQEVDKLKEELKKITRKEIQINISEIKRPEIDAVIVGNTVASQIEGRISYRRAIKTSIASAMRIGAEGIKIMISGRVGGAEMARREQYKEGRIPLHTFRADIDYATAEAHTTYGIIGIKVWICKGDIYGRPDLVPDAATAKVKPSQHRGGDRPGDRDRDRGGRGDRGGDRRSDDRRSDDRRGDRGPSRDGGRPRGSGRR